MTNIQFCKQLLALLAFHGHYANFHGDVAGRWSVHVSTPERDFLIANSDSREDSLHADEERVWLGAEDDESRFEYDYPADLLAVIEENQDMNRFFICTEDTHVTGYFRELDRELAPAFGEPCKVYDDEVLS